MTEMEPNGEAEAGVPPPPPPPPPPQKTEAELTTENNTNSSEPKLSKNAQKKLARQQRWEAKKVEKKAAAKEQKKKELERKRKEWDESLANMSEDERTKLIESRICLRKERMEKTLEEKHSKKERLVKAKEQGQNVVVDLEFSHLMSSSEIRSLVQQIIYCYAANGRCESPSHLWLTGCEGEMDNQLKKIPGFDKWIIEKEDKSYIEVLQDRKDDLVYLTADSETVLEELDLNKIYIIGGLVDRNRHKGITMEKAQNQGIQTAKLPIGNFLKMSSSQVLTVNQVLEIILKFLETRDWKTSFFAVIPQRKRTQADSEGNADNNTVEEEEECEQNDDLMACKKQCVEEEEIEQKDELIMAIIGATCIRSRPATMCWKAKTKSYNFRVEAKIQFCVYIVPRWVTSCHNGNEKNLRRSWKSCAPSSRPYRAMMVRNF